MGVSDKIEQLARHMGPPPERLSTPPRSYAVLCLMLTIIFGGLMFLRPLPWAALFVIFHRLSGDQVEPCLAGAVTFVSLE